MENQTLSWIILLILRLSFMTYIADGLNVPCSSPVNGQYGESLTLPCDFPPDPVGVYWFEEHDTEEPVIRLEEDLRAGRGLESGEYNITDNGDLLIIDANFSHEQRFQVYVIDRSYEVWSFDIDVTIIQECRASNAVVGQKTTIGCSFKPGFLGIYWHDEDNDVAPFIRLQRSVRYGRRFDTGEYNITNNGSLVINQVTSAHNYSIYVIMEDGSDATFYAQLTITDGQSTTPELDAIPFQTEIDTHGNTSLLENTTRISTTAETPKILTEQPGNNEIPTGRIVDGYTTDVRNEIKPQDPLDPSNNKAILASAVCVVVLVLILVTVIPFFVIRRRRHSIRNNGVVYKNANGEETVKVTPNGNPNDQEIPREGVQN